MKSFLHKGYYTFLLFLLSPLFLTAQVDSTCSMIERSVDDFTDVITIMSPMYYNRKVQKVNLQKAIDKKETSFYISFYSRDNYSVNMGERGLHIIFDDGSKFYRDCEVDADINSSDASIDYSAFLSLSKTEFTMFSKKKIKKYRLYIYDEVVDDKTAFFIQNAASCIINMK